MSAPNPRGCSFRGNIVRCTSARADLQDSARLRTCATQSCKVARKYPLLLFSQNGWTSGESLNDFSRLSTRVNSCKSDCAPVPVSYTHLRAHETDSYLVCRLLL